MESLIATFDTAFSAVAESLTGTSTVIVFPVLGSTLVIVWVSFLQEIKAIEISAMAVIFFIIIIFGLINLLQSSKILPILKSQRQI